MTEIMNLWGDDFKPKEDDVSSILKKSRNKKNLENVSTEKKIKSKSVSIEEKMKLIKEDVYRILGKYKDDTIVIRDLDTFKSYIDKSINTTIIAIDTETCDDNGYGTLDTIDCGLVGLCLYTPGEKNAYIPVNHRHFSIVEDEIVLGDRLENQLTEADIKNELSRVNVESVKKIFHNAAFDIGVIMSTCGIRLEPSWDTSIGAKVLNELELKSLKEQYKLHIDPEQDKYNIEHLFKGLPYVIFDPELFALYAATDSFMTEKLYEYQEEQFNLPDNKDIRELFLNVEMPCIDAVVDMQQTGISVDIEYANKISKQYHEKLDMIDLNILDELKKLEPLISEWRLSPEANSAKRVYPAKKTKIKEEDIPNKFPLVDEKGNHYKLSGKSPAQQLSDPIEVTSTTQLQILLYDILKVGVVDKSDPRGTGSEILEELAKKYLICQLILDKREVQILLDTFVDKIPTLVKKKTGKVHAKFNQYGADTGRFSSGEKDPNNPKAKSLNLQNIPAADKTIRMIFKASPGYSLLGNDYSAQEPRSLASFSNDVEMLKAYEEDKDLYAVIGSACFNNNYEDNLEHNPVTGEINPEGKKRRSVAKMIQLAISYSMSAYSMSKRIDVSVERAEQIIEDFYKKFSGVKKFTDDSQKMLLEKGYVTDLWGRRRHLPDALLPDYTIVPVKESNEFNPLIGAITHEDETLQAKIKKYEQQLSKAKWKKDVDEIILQAKRDGLKVRNNKAFKSRALRQCLNARIQGTAASMTKRAMGLIHNDKKLNELGFRLLCTVHDEVFGEAPKENAEEAGKRLSELMIEAAKEKCVCKFKGDPYVVSRWYEDEAAAEVLKDYNKIVNNGVDEIKAIEEVKNKYSMINPIYVEQMCRDEYLVNEHEDI